MKYLLMGNFIVSSYRNLFRYLDCMQFEQSFVERLIQYDDLAFAQFYEQSVDQFFRYIITHYSLSKQEGQDLLSDVYLKIWNNMDKFDPKYQFWQFVRTILKNHCKDYFKVTKPLLFSDLVTRHDDGSVTNISDTIESEDNTSDFFQAQFDNDMIQNALDKLDEESQELIHSRYVLQYSYDTLSDMYGLSNDTIRQKVSRIIKKLRENLKNIR